jgi:hypothetical protein
MQAKLVRAKYKMVTETLKRIIWQLQKNNCKGFILELVLNYMYLYKFI